MQNIIFICNIACPNWHISFLHVIHLNAGTQILLSSTGTATCKNFKKYQDILWYQRIFIALLTTVMIL